MWHGICYCLELTHHNIVTFCYREHHFTVIILLYESNLFFQSAWFVLACSDQHDMCVCQDQSRGNLFDHFLIFSKTEKNIITLEYDSASGNRNYIM